MQDEPLNVSDGEEEDKLTDVMLVRDSPSSMTRKSLDQIREQERGRHILQEKQQDEELKELGLYEEGMTVEQKEELLLVLAASRETAQHEESMRKQAQEWEHSLLVYERGEATKNSKNRPCISTKNATVQVHPTSTNEPEKSPYVLQDEYIDSPRTLQRNNFTEERKLRSSNALSSNTVSGAIISENIQPDSKNEMQDSYPSKDFKLIDSSKNPSCDSDDIIASQEITCSQKEHGRITSSRRNNTRLSRRSGRRQMRGNEQTSTAELIDHSVKMDTNDPDLQDDNPDLQMSSSSCSPVESHSERLLTMEKDLPVWSQPDARTVAVSILPFSHKRKAAEELSESLPYFCPDKIDPEKHILTILDSIKQYHMWLHKLQRQSLVHHSWGEGITVGWHYSNSLDVTSCTPSTTTNDTTDYDASWLGKRQLVGAVGIVKDENRVIPDLEKWTCKSSLTDRLESETVRRSAFPTARTSPFSAQKCTKCSHNGSPNIFSDTEDSNQSFSSGSHGKNKCVSINAVQPNSKMNSKQVEQCSSSTVVQCPQTYAIQNGARDYCDFSQSSQCALNCNSQTPTTVKIKDKPDEKILPSETIDIKTSAKLSCARRKLFTEDSDTLNKDHLEETSSVEVSHSTHSTTCVSTNNKSSPFLQKAIQDSISPTESNISSTHSESSSGGLTRQENVTQENLLGQAKEASLSQGPNQQTLSPIVKIVDIKDEVTPSDRKVQRKRKSDSTKVAISPENSEFSSLTKRPVIVLERVEQLPCFKKYTSVQKDVENKPSMRFHMAHSPSHTVQRKLSKKM